MPEGQIGIIGRLTGFEGVIEDIRRQAAGILESEAESLASDLRDLLEEIKRDYVPIETGELRDSGYVNGPFFQNGAWTVEIGFGAEHALIQHERLDYYHPHGQAKYLEEPLQQLLSRRRSNRSSQPRDPRTGRFVKR
jgi:hypothetical protein